ncbi:MAG: cysteine desulfurase [Planctomycetes bacterium]|nr:cysteine desulfurase [Planctomycetota bacterium]
MDNAATTRLDPEVLDAMLPFLKNGYGNPSSVHSFGAEARRALEHAREECAKCLETRPEHIIFTSSGSEANNLIIKGSMGSMRHKKVLTTPLEHPSVSEPLKTLGAHDYSITTVPINPKGRVDLSRLETILTRDRYGLFCLVHGSNEVGSLQPVLEIGRLVKTLNPDTWFHLDAVQSVGHVALDPKAWGVDSLALSSHKIHGPRGAGILALYRDIQLRPLIAGGGQENGRRSGSENLPAIIGTASSLHLALAALPQAGPRMARLRDRLQQGMEQRISGLLINGDPAQGLPHILNVSFSGLLGEVLLHHLEKEGIMVSTGSACHAKWKEVSATLKALKIPTRFIRGTLRFSLSRYSSNAEIDTTLEVLEQQVAYLREVGL